MEYAQLSESAFILAALGWVLFQCSSLLIMARWLCPSKKINSQRPASSSPFQQHDSLPVIHRATVSQH